MSRKKLGVGFACRLAFVLLLTMPALATGPAHAEPTAPPPTGLAAKSEPSGHVPDASAKTQPRAPDLPGASPALAASSGIANGGFENGPDGSWLEYSYQGWPIILPGGLLSWVRDASQRELGCLAGG